MKKLFMLSLASLCLLPLAQAGCEDGESISEQATIEYVSGNFPNAKSACEAKSVFNKRISSGELHIVLLKCGTGGETSARFKVELKEIEDAYCMVEKVSHTK